MALSERMFGPVIILQMTRAGHIPGCETPGLPAVAQGGGINVDRVAEDPRPFDALIRSPDLSAIRARAGDVGQVLNVAFLGHDPTAAMMRIRARRADL